MKFLILGFSAILSLSSCKQHESTAMAAASSELIGTWQSKCEIKINMEHLGIGNSQKILTFTQDNKFVHEEVFYDKFDVTCKKEKLAFIINENSYVTTGFRSIEFTNLARKMKIMHQTVLDELGPMMKEFGIKNIDLKLNTMIDMTGVSVGIGKVEAATFHLQNSQLFFNENLGLLTKIH